MCLSKPFRKMPTHECLRPNHVNHDANEAVATGLVASPQSQLHPLIPRNTRILAGKPHSCKLIPALMTQREPCSFLASLPILLPPHPDPAQAGRGDHGRAVSGCPCRTASVTAQPRSGKHIHVTLSNPWASRGNRRKQV